MDERGSNKHGIGLLEESTAATRTPSEKEWE
jgi:hypothetical protein